MLLSALSFRSARPLFAASATAILCAACAQDGSQLNSLQLSEPAPAAGIEPVTKAPLATASLPDIEVSPKVGAAIREARALRQSGKKAAALELLDKTAGADKDPVLVAERGLLALELGKLDKAEKLLARAQNASRPDWRLQSAYGAALSANGKQLDAQTQFAKALANAPDQPAILNNLALSYALDGKHDEAERVLRQASQVSNSPQAKQNLALILGLRGKTSEAKAIAEGALPPDKAKANVAYFEQLHGGGTSVSRADVPAAQPVRAASFADPQADQPIMQLGTHN